MSYQQPTHYTPLQAPYPQMSMPPQPQVYQPPPPPWPQGYTYPPYSPYYPYTSPVSMPMPTPHPCYAHYSQGGPTPMCYPQMPQVQAWGQQLPQVQQQQYPQQQHHQPQLQQQLQLQQQQQVVHHIPEPVQAQPHIQLAQQQQHEQPHNAQLQSQTHVQQPKEREQHDLPPNDHPKPAQLDVVHSEILESTKIDGKEDWDSQSPSLDHLREKR
uniref:Uncharacterized protein n=1 Tax=Crassostrea virginica TaxID=6565 RepID=A0A8B8C7Z0_CRAVI|nr:putative uncharacterized protein DDB_G0294196 [Crassostrea virginica]